MRASSFLTVLFFTTLIFFGFQILSPPSSAFTLTAIVDIKPDTLNVNMKGRWITAYITSEDFNVSDIDPSTILLEDVFTVVWSNIEGEVLMVKFDAQSVTDYLFGKLYHMGIKRGPIDLEVTGQLKAEGAQFSGIDTITVMNPFEY